MTLAAALTTRSTVAAIALAFGVVLTATHGACVLVAPSGDLPRLPELRPTIVHSSLVPIGPIISYFPEKFVVQVELADPTATFYYAAFIDYNPSTGQGLVDQARQSRYSPSNTDPSRAGRIRTIEVAVAPPPDLGSCHKIEIVVALRLKATTDPKNSHTPEEPGGDIATWIYNPSGDLQGCPILDAGIATLPDAGVGEGGAE